MDEANLSSLESQEVILIESITTTQFNFQPNIYEINMFNQCQDSFKAKI